MRSTMQDTDKAEMTQIMMSKDESMPISMRRAIVNSRIKNRSTYQGLIFSSWYQISLLICSGNSWNLSSQAKTEADIRKTKNRAAVLIRVGKVLTRSDPLRLLTKDEIIRTKRKLRATGKRSQLSIREGTREILVYRDGLFSSLFLGYIKWYTLKRAKKVPKQNRIPAKNRLFERKSLVSYTRSEKGQNTFWSTSQVQKKDQSPETRPKFLTELNRKEGRVQRALEMRTI